MGRKLDALLGRNFKTSKFKALARLAISRIAILKNQRQARYSQAKSDVIELLKLGHHERALLRVEHVIKDQNMMDAFGMIEDYCYLLIERVVLLQKNKECPDELKEAISSLIFASSRCGEFPELHEIRGVFVSRFGKEVAARAVELRNNCGVSPKIIQKLSARQPSLESRLKELKGIAKENGIVLQVEEDAPIVAEDKLDVSHKQEEEKSHNSAKLDNTKPQDKTHLLLEESNPEKMMSESLKARKKYRDVAAAAQEAFESAAYAAEAARAAVELSRSDSQDSDQDDDDGGPSHPQGNMYDSDGSLTPKHLSSRYEGLEEMKLPNDRLKFDKIHPSDNIGSESEDEDTAEDNDGVHGKEWEEISKKKPGIDRTTSISSSDSDGNISSERKLSCSVYQKGSMGNQTVSYASDKKVEMEQVRTPSPMHLNLDSYGESSSPRNERQVIRQYNAVEEEDCSNKFGTELPYKSSKWIPLKSYAESTVNPKKEKSKLENAHSSNFEEQLHSQHSRIDRQHLSMRTRRAQWD